MARMDDMAAWVFKHGQPVCDDCVWRPAGMTSRQQANSRGRALARRGVIARGQGTCSLCGKVKTVSAPRGTELPTVAESSSEDHPWYWEGNVQATLADYLASQGWSVTRTANTATKETGVDIEATDPTGADWWITVKGYPERKPGKTTSPSTQARHWFSHAMFDVVTYRTERENMRIGVALPGPYVTYESLASRSAWLRRTAPYTLFVVDARGVVHIRTPDQS